MYRGKMGLDRCVDQGSSRLSSLSVMFRLNFPYFVPGRLVSFHTVLLPL